ncbi:class I SAM-dependent methyltransferase [Streptomyces europaeiscabiei]|uniref:Class I SAM-dependent methyltransferase n=1 Tax=Streptomyces europaeiscabiei TaxID=146819 RepID=A0ABU4N742_9ACTN|nr:MULTISPECIES: class I SAM-dependent methyltransferase [Streptomyces]MDX2526948.1 class I SAM-dependent methyltransferase [Streptomyces europaeiscabiei]MDX3542016.1 class I SAM-dependent methyltransferase [Streptomyces europaeiscabiei]MDX3551064.1 class I SAM-dependent methyltransferase [Streptomyces europaeiscabiei]MDX3665235.1 class I SAM-dependent methyltransferase [Streptomyces europaeiscabiei]MDX3698376.1 class I SAM-dependent methyltransferase [Streptomyces europaeiscabiei]
MSVTSGYREAWEGFWREAPEGPGEVFWDAGPEWTAAVHVALFEPYLTAPALPLVDLGCGNGTQTRYLADRFPTVIGADLSTAALDRARRADPGRRSAYRLLDAADKTDAETLHADLGDANVYVRGVLHQCEPDDRQRLVDTIATLLGERGRVCLVELAEAAKPVLMGLAQSPTGPPAKLAPIFRHNIAPGEVTDAAVPRYLRASGLTLVADGDLPLITTEHTADGTRIELPSRWYVAGRTA